MTIPYKAILVPLDGSALSEQALPHATMLAQQSGAELTLFRAVPYLSEELLDSEVLPMNPADLEKQQHQMVTEATSALQELVLKLKAQKIAAKAVVEVGQAATQIVEYAEAHGIDLIVMCTHGRTGIGRWLVGSVADQVASAAPCPLLLIRPA